MTDAGWMPENLAALLGCQPDDPQLTASVSTAAAVTHLIGTRAISERRALLIVKNGRCDECLCELGKAVDPDACLCACHCDCCCPPLFHCVTTCSCKCDCHCDPNSSNDESVSDDETEVDAAQRTPDSQPPSAAQAPQPFDETVAETASSVNTIAVTTGSYDDAVMTASDGEASSDRPDTGENGDADDAMTGTAPIRQALDKLHAGQLTALLVKYLTRTDAQAELNSREVAKEIFVQQYNMIKPVENQSSGAKPNGDAKQKKPANPHLPSLRPDEEDRLYELLHTLVNDLKQSPARLAAAIKDIAVAAARSTWSLKNILDQRLRSAKTPRAPPVNVWTRADSTATFVERQHGTDVFRFDDAVFSAEEMSKLRAICYQEHVFAESTRAPTADEWVVMMGMMSGSIIAGALPQFLKRCCTLLQIVWLHDEIRTRAEGEVWVQLPVLAKMYNYNQSTRRLVEALRQGAAHQKWTDTRFETMLNSVKSIAYNKTLHSIHFFFYTKHEATQWEGMPIPFRASKLVLRNPETKLRRSANATGLPTDDDDGLVNDRYQAHHQTRLINVPRTLDLSAIIAFLQDISGNSFKSGTPLDTYGPHAEGSLMWDLFAHNELCPEILRDIHRINWNGHLILLQHRPDSGPQPCFQCARVGHQTATCPTPEADWNTTTLTVTAQEAAKYTKRHPPWKSMEDVKRIFASLIPATTTTDTKTTASATEADAASGLSGEESAGTATDSSMNDGTVAAGSSTSGEQDNSNSTNAHDAVGQSAGEPGKAPTGQQPPPVNHTRDSNPVQRDDSAPTSGSHQTETQQQTSGTVGPSKKPPQWQTANKKAKKTSSKQTQAHTVRDKNTTSPSNSGSTSVKNGNRFTTLVVLDDDDSDDSDYEDEKYDTNKKQHQGTPPKPIDLTSEPGSQSSDEVELARALHVSNLEHARVALHRLANEDKPEFASETVEAAVARARPNIGTKSSIPWMLEAINGRLVDTPDNGNCLNYAFTEALWQKALKATDDEETMIDAVRLFKYALYEAHMATPAAVHKNTHVTAMLSITEGEAADLTQKEQDALVKTFYSDLACSDSALNNVLPRRLWGHLDAIRMGAAALDCTVFLISEHTDRTNCHLNVFRRQRNKQGEEFIAMSQPGVSGWLDEFEAVGRRTGQAPIVLVHANNHYSSVLLDRHQPATSGNAPKKLKPAVLSDIWQQTSLDNVIATAASKHRKAAASRTNRRAVLESDASITAPDLIGFLTDEGWNAGEKSELVSILVAGAVNVRELLTFSTTTPGSEPALSPESTQESAGSGTSLYETDSDSSDDDTMSSQAYSLPSQGSTDYGQWATEIWEPVRETWLHQFAEPLPELTDSAGLLKLALRAPEDLFEAGRWCSNAFALLDHFTTDAIRAWMARYWLEHCLTALQQVVPQLPDPGDRQKLLDWIEAIRSEPQAHSVGLRMWRNKENWNIIRQHLPLLIEGERATPMMTPKYMTKYAYILLLDHLFPDLAKHLLQAEGVADDTSPVSMIDAYRRAPTFQAVLSTAMQKRSWGPVSAHMNSLQMDIAEMPTRQY